MYTTRAIVLSSKMYAEADVIYTLLTERLGIIQARATGVRKPHSKMSAHLQKLAEIKVTLVRGKYQWRLTGAENITGTIHFDLRHTEKICVMVFARIARFLCRMTVPNNDAIEHLYDAIAFARQQSITVCNKTNAGELEVKTLAKILHLLGYLSTDILQKEEQGLLSLNELTDIVNKSIKESQM